MPLITAFLFLFHIELLCRICFIVLETSPVQQGAMKSRFIPLKWSERKKNTTDPQHLLLLSFGVCLRHLETLLPQGPGERTGFGSFIWLF